MLNEYYYLNKDSLSVRNPYIYSNIFSIFMTVYKNSLPESKLYD